MLLIVKRLKLYEMVICIAGKNEIAVNALKFILNNKPENYTVVGLPNTHDDGVNGWQPSFKFACISLKVPLVTLEECYKEKDLIFLSLEFAQLIKPKNFLTTKLFNFHFSLLPAYKGSLTSIYPILNGDTHSGVTLHRIDVGIDTGKIIAQNILSIDPTHNSRNLYDSYNKYALDLLKMNFSSLLSNTFTEKVQPVVGSSFYSAKSISFTDININLYKTAFEINNQVRAFAFREYQLPSIKEQSVYRSELIYMRAIGKPGTIIIQNEDWFLINAIDYQVKIFKDREVALFEAATKGDINEVKRIGDAGFDINIKNKKGWNILLVACYNQQMPLVLYLISKGFEANSTNYKGTTALMFAKSAATRTGNIELLQWMLENGADVSLRDDLGKSALDYARINDAQAVIELLESFEKGSTATQGLENNRWPSPHGSLGAIEMQL